MGCSGCGGGNVEGAELGAYRADDADSGERHCCVERDGGEVRR